MPSTSPRRDTLGVGLAAGGIVLVILGILAVWLIVPLAGAALTIALGALLIVLGVQSVTRPSR